MDGSIKDGKLDEQSECVIDIDGRQELPGTSYQRSGRQSVVDKASELQTPTAGRPTLSKDGEETLDNLLRSIHSSLDKKIEMVSERSDRQMAEHMERKMKSVVNRLRESRLGSTDSANDESVTSGEIKRALAYVQDEFDSKLSGLEHRFNTTMERKEARIVSRMKTAGAASETKEASFSQAFLAYTQTSTCHGVAYVFQPGAHVVRRVLWIAVWLLGLASLLYICSDGIGRYRAGDVHDILETMPGENELFPAMSVCHSGLLDPAYIDRKLDEGDYLVKYYKLNKHREIIRYFSYKARHKGFGYANGKILSERSIEYFIFLAFRETFGNNPTNNQRFAEELNKIKNVSLAAVNTTHYSRLVNATHWYGNWSIGLPAKHNNRSVLRYVKDEIEKGHLTIDMEKLVTATVGDVDTMCQILMGHKRCDYYSYYLAELHRTLAGTHVFEGAIPVLRDLEGKLINAHVNADTLVEIGWLSTHVKLYGRIKPFVDRRYGLCWTVSFYDAKGTALLAKETISPQLILLQLEVTYWNDKDPYLLVKFHADDEPLVDMETDSIRFTEHDFGKHALSLARKDYVLLPPPYGNCLETEATDFLNPLAYHYYSYEACMFECLDVLHARNEGCHLLGSRSQLIERVCDQSDQLMGAETSKACSIRCRPPCKQTRYSLAATKLTSKYNSNLIHLSVTFREEAYTRVTQHAVYPLSSLLGEIGGTIGLFMGCSLFTFVELFDLFLVYVYGLLMQRQRKEETAIEHENLLAA